MERHENELEKLEQLTASFSSMGNFTQIMRETYSLLESKYEGLNSRLARINELLRNSLAERNRLAQYLNNILESLDSGVIVTDTEGIVNVFNSAAEEYTGIAAEEALGKKYHQVLDIKLSDLSGNSPLTGEMELAGANGQAIPVAYSVTRLRQIDDNDHGGMVMILYNLTEIKRLEDNLKRISTLAALGEMAATVAHEIRNPLAGISGFTALLLRDLEPHSETRRIVEKISGGVASLNAIVTSLLDYTRNVCPEIADVNPIAVVEDAISDLKAGNEVINHTINIECGARKLKARLDPNLFRMIVFNLVKNAVQVNPDGGSVKLTLKNAGSGEFILMVEDNGPGIPDHALDKLFTPFFTTRVNGTGLGLATVKKLTELHGGRVCANNKPDGGAVFTVQFPGATKGAIDEV